MPLVRARGPGRVPVAAAGRSPPSMLRSGDQLSGGLAGRTQAHRGVMAQQQYIRGALGTLWLFDTAPRRGHPRA